MNFEAPPESRMLFTHAGRSTNKYARRKWRVPERFKSEFFHGAPTVAMDLGLKLATDLQGNDDKTHPSLVRLVVHRRLRADVALDVPAHI